MTNPTLAMIKATWYLLVFVSLACLGSAQSDVILNEIGASTDSRTLRWDDDDQPKLGAGYAWWEAGFDASQWWNGPGPHGVSRPDLGTDVDSLISGKTPSLYLRKTFQASSQQASSSLHVLLEIDYNDGFIAYLNGEEIARSRMGPVKGFAYADQYAMTTRPNASGTEVYDLGPADEILIDGDNLLAIQVHNDSMSGDLLAKASLVFDGASEIVSEDFDTANGAERTHDRSGNSVSNTAQGSPANGSWLDEASDPESSNAWSDLVIVTEEDQSLGSTDLGALRYTLTSDDSLESASMFSPAFDLSSQWSTGNVTIADLANTTLSFAVQMPDNFAMSVSIEGANGTGPALTAFPGLVRAPSADLIGYWRFDDAGVSEGDAMTGTPNILNPGVLDGSDRGSPRYSSDVPGPVIYDPITNTTRANDYSMDANGADARLTIPNQSALNTNSFTTEFFIKVLEEPDGYEAFAQRSEGGATSATSTRRRWKIDFDHGDSHFGKVRGQWDTPGTPPLDFQRVSRGERIWVDTPSGNGDPSSYNPDSNPAPQGNGRNDDTDWHHVAITFNGDTQETRIYTDGIAGESLVLNGTYVHPDAVMQFGKFGESYDLLIDEIRYTGRVLRPDEFLTTNLEAAWQTYTIRLSDADTASQSAFLSQLNATNETDVRLVFTMLDDSYSTTGKSFAIDDFSISYNDAGFPAILVGATNAWQYFPGLIEPSGGVFDRAVLEDSAISNDFSDWIELHNNAGETVDLGGWTLSDDDANPTKWTIPANTEIPANGHLLILADNLVLSNPNFLHTNFKLSAGGEYLGLFNDAGQLQSEFAPTYPTQYSHTSYGRSSSDSTIGYLEFPTPGAANIGPANSDRVDAPDFDIKGGFYDDPVSVTLTSQTVGASIRYTTDASEPTLINGVDYDGPITVNAVSSSSGTVIRARAFLDGMIPSKTKAHTYLIDQDSRLRSAPALVFAADLPKSLYKPHGVLAIEGGQHVNDVWEPNTADDYNHALFRGRAFERPIHIEYYFADGTAGFRTDAGIRFAGSNSVRPEIVLAHLDESPWRAEKREKPSFNVYFRDDYGNPDVTFPLNGDLYPVDRFEQLRIRAGKNDDHNPFILDEWVRRLYNQMGQVGSVGAINSLYVNGDFKGFYNTVERLREPFFNAHYGLPSSTDWDVLQAGNENDIASGDRVAWDAMLGLMNASINESNWNAILETADVVNMADYFLLNIYMGMWDWPNNNWVAARERSSAGRYRFYVWDAEGAIHRNGNKSIDYNTIEDDLNDLSGELPDCWQALMRWPEFQMLFADRIHRHLFNDGILDDRNFNNSTIKAVYDGLENEYADLLDFRLGETVDRDDLNDWVDPSDGRRTYLLGPARDDFSDNELWPNTEPVEFSQHGGAVGQGFELVISHNEGGSADVYYTVDGTDPRAYGGSVSASALDYPSGGLTLNSGITHVLARVRDSSGNWSPLTEATFSTGTEEPNSNNLVVSEIHYHPVDALDAVGITYPDKDDFEFIQILNVGNSTIDLTGVRFDGSVQGIEYQFGNATLSPDAYAILVKNPAAFEARYGAGLPVYGSYDGKLSNGGEQITLRDGDGAIIHQFTYSDDAPWPNLADGFGRALQLIDPQAAPDHNNAVNWTASTVVHGTPGGVIPEYTFDSWQDLHFSTAQLSDTSFSGPNADPDGDGMSNLVEYGLGTLPLVAASEEIFPIVYNQVEDGGESYLGMVYRVATTASDLDHVVEVSSDHSNWDDSSNDVVNVVAPRDEGDGSVTYSVRDNVSLSNGKRRFMRIRFTQE